MESQHGQNACNQPGDQRAGGQAQAAACAGIARTAAQPTYDASVQPKEGPSATVPAIGAASPHLVDEGADAAQPIPSIPGGRVPTLAPQEVLLDAACAFDCLARYTQAGNCGQLSKTQADAVMRIALFGPASMTALAGSLGASKEHVTRAIASLEALGLVTKRRNEENRRVVEAVLTPEGDRMATAIRLKAISRLDAPLACLSPAERDELMELATRAVALLLKVRLG